MSALSPAAPPGVPVSCNGPCARTGPQAPPFEVACPRCGANPGTYCVRPSGHSGPFVAFHKERDLAALAAGHYGGPCVERDGCRPPASDSPTVQPAFPSDLFDS